MIYPNKPAISPNSLTVLLIATVLLFFLVPLATIYSGSHGFKILFTAVGVSCIYLVSHKKRDMIVAFVLALPGFSTTPFLSIFEFSALRIFGLISYILLYVFAISIIVRHMRNMTVVTYNTITGAVCIYLLLGLVWSIMYAIIELLQPHSFNGLYSSHGISPQDFFEVFGHLFYYSYVTLTTLGYGSVSPHTLLASAFSCAEALTGQLYLAIIVARFVSVFASQESKVNKD